jgi:Mg-chelatase subunit ChlI
MPDSVELLATYLHLARASGLRRRPHVRDRLLIMAAVSATKAGLPRIAAWCREDVLRSNPRHLLRKWETIADALRDPEFQHFLQHLQKRYSPEAADRMMDTLAIDRARERDTYYSDEEYAAALLGSSLEQLAQRFPE